ncbi:CocE/NonD family hydrolase [Pseudoalteromonas sp. MMG005]|uniref:CocE/NonD family hydrolase n=1 Tax=Pseudoalteromonas sp. MMG005 TaxID=2822682 RepID=UPI001B39D9BD|nr:CocE/NonD family hydrolase [Pseudoalteromonas sp. MMG005]MBQ4845053.1 CocE/NonD family hydrolase [Pseudoalteromonas sp. MMG005]
MKNFLFLLLICVATHTSVVATELVLPESMTKDDTALAASMQQLAKQVLTLCEQSACNLDNDTLFRVQSAAGLHGKALLTLEQLKTIKVDKNGELIASLVPFYVVAQVQNGLCSNEPSLKRVFAQVFRTVFASLDNKRASKAIQWFKRDVKETRQAFDLVLEKHKHKTKISRVAAIELLRHFQHYQAHQLWAPFVGSLIAEDDDKRYIIDKNVLIKMPDGAHVAAMIVRPKNNKKTLPTLLNFTIYHNAEKEFSKIRESAARGYAGAVAYTRGKGHSPDIPIPYEHDGEDASNVINWLSKQTWSDGRVGMFGGSYDGFTQWAALKHLPPALKTIVPYVANNPGDGLPMENNIFLFVNYAWPFYTTNNKTLDNEIYSDHKRWNELNEKWYQSGKSYREVDSVDGLENKWLQRWLLHPSYDKYWQNMVPYKDEFAKLNIPVLTITGYYDDGQQSALHYLKEHYKYNSNAEHYLLIGPYDHFGAQAVKKSSTLRSYTIDPVAHFDTSEITYQWMDHIFYGAQKPSLIKDKINYQVMGSNEWKHAPSIEKQSNEVLTLYLSNLKSGDKNQLTPTYPSELGFLYQEVDFSDRKTSNNDYYPYPIVGKKPDLSNGYSFISAPFDTEIEVSGTFSGEIKATINKKDMDIGVVLYEVMPNGALFHLSYFLGRASYAKDMSKRSLLTPYKVTSIPFDKTRMVSRKLSKGSRLLVTLNINKNSFAQINYGTGKDVSDENISDAKEPLQIKWHNNSSINVPIYRAID